MHVLARWSGYFCILTFIWTGSVHAQKTQGTQGATANPKKKVAKSLPTRKTRPKQQRNPTSHPTTKPKTVEVPPTVKKLVAPPSKPTHAPKAKDPKKIKVTLEGTLVGFDNKPVRMGRVLLQRRNVGITEQRIVVDSRGKWHFQAEVYGVYHLTFRGAHHAPHTLILLLTRPRKIQLHVRLGTYSKFSRNRKKKKSKKPAKPPAVLLRLKGKKKWKQIPMQRQSNGEYLADIPGHLKLIRYQIKGWASHAIAGTDARALFYSKKNGSYSSIFAPSNGKKIQLHFSPQKCPPFGQKASVRSLPAKALTIHTFYQLFHRTERASWKEYRRLRKKRGYFRYSHNWKPYFKRIRKQMAVEKDTEIRQALWLLTVNLWGHREKYGKSKNRFRRTLKMIPPDSPLWSLRKDLARTMIRYHFYFKPGVAEAFEKDFFAKHPNPGLRFYVHRKLATRAFWEHRYLKRKFQPYQKARQRVERKLYQQLSRLLYRYQDKTLDAETLLGLQKKIRYFMQDFMAKVLSAKSLKSYHRSYRAPKYLMLYRNPKHYYQKAWGHYQAMRKIAEQLKNPRFHRMVKRIKWKLRPVYKKGKKVGAFSLALLPPHKVLRQSDLQGRYTLMIFWATWCGPCIAKMPFLHRIHKMYKSKGLRMVSISIDRRRSLVEAFRKKKYPIPWRNAVCNNKEQEKIEELFEVSSIPKMFLVGPSGRIIASNEVLQKKKKMLKLLRRILGSPTKQIKTKTPPTSRPSKKAPTSRPIKQSPSSKPTQK